MTLDQYRMLVVERLKACRDATCARDLVDKAHAVLGSTVCSDQAKTKFWDTLNEDLTILAEDYPILLPSAEVPGFGAAITAAKHAVFEYQVRIPK